LFVLTRSNVKTTATKKTHPTRSVFLEEVCQQNAVVEGQEPERVSTENDGHSTHPGFLVVTNSTRFFAKQHF